MFKFWRQKKEEGATGSPSPVAKIAPAKTSTQPPPSDAPLKDKLENMNANKGKELVTLFNIATTQKLSTDEYLYKPGQTADSAFIVLDGHIEETRASHDIENHVADYPAKSWISFADFDGTVTRNYSARATEPSRVMLIDQRVLNSVDDDVLLFIFRELQRSSTQQRFHKTTKKEILLAHNQNLANTLLNLRLQEKERSKNSELAQTVIQKIPKLPIATIALLNKLTDNSTSTNEVVELVKSDPSLTSILLKTLNSADYTFEEKISDVTHAVSLMGFVGVHQIVMSQSLRKSLPPTPAFQKSYLRSLEISHIAFAISQASGIGKPAEMATIGLVHELGNVVLELLRQQNPKLENLIEFFDTSVIGAQLLKTWNLPESIWQAIEYQDFPEFAPPEKIPDAPLTAIAVIYLARLCHQRLNKVSESLMPTLYLNDYLSLLNWDGFSLGDVLGEKVVPVLRKKGNALPTSLAEIIS